MVMNDSAAWITLNLSMIITFLILKFKITHIILKNWINNIEVNTWINNDNLENVSYYLIYWS